jgi:hypothetical protein
MKDIKEILKDIKDDSSKTVQNYESIYELLKKLQQNYLNEGATNAEKL